MECPYPSHYLVFGGGDRAHRHVGADGRSVSGVVALPVQRFRLKPQLTSGMGTCLFLSPPLLRLAFLSGSDGHVFERSKESTISKEFTIFVVTRTCGRSTSGLRSAQRGRSTKGVTPLALLKRREVEI